MTDIITKRINYEANGDIILAGETTTSDALVLEHGPVKH